MLRLASIVSAFTLLAACTSDGAEGNPWYSQGDVTYDSVRAASDACKAKGGDFQLKPGGDPTHQGDYACNPKKGS
jgi:hypothetical protein